MSDDAGGDSSDVGGDGGGEGGEMLEVDMAWASVCVRTNLNSDFDICSFGALRDFLGNASALFFGSRIIFWIPDLFSIHTPPKLFEVKCFTPFHLGTAVGHGCPSTTDGHLIAFGGTLEQAHATIFGREERGAAGEQRFNHLTGKGRVDPKPGDYSDDALKKKHLVYLMHTETTGALSPTVTKIFHTCAKAVIADPSLDSTIYVRTARTARRPAASTLTTSLLSHPRSCAQTPPRLLTPPPPFGTRTPCRSLAFWHLGNASG